VESEDALQFFQPIGAADTLAALIHGFGGAEAVAFAAEFAFWSEGAGALLAGTRFGFRQFLAPAGEAGFADGDARATGAFGATLAAVGFARVGVAFARPLVLFHSAAGTRRSRNRFPQTSASLFFRFHRGLLPFTIISSGPVVADGMEVGKVISDQLRRRGLAGISEIGNPIRSIP
jgi:hypothetical protein